MTSSIFIKSNSAVNHHGPLIVPLQLHTPSISLTVGTGCSPCTMQNTSPWESLKDIIGLSLLSNSNHRLQCPHTIFFSLSTASQTIQRWETAGSRNRPDYKSRRTTTGPSTAYTSSPNPSDMANRPLLLDTGRDFKFPSRGDSEYFTTRNNLALVTQQQELNTGK